ncbi:hypothetical protein RND71_019125 [Anisodus tanguticus]|uniref:Uncharacterized protein n=1 Tax=Anisodus tanguticus TaxID=243964 RepID=A0AAE1V875_9SOLA|nr:hypothetical protein RND71_019125 [Anisodus tanguticus]
MYDCMRSEIFSMFRLVVRKPVKIMRHLATMIDAIMAVALLWLSWPVRKLNACKFLRVAQTLENVMANSGPANQSYASDHTGVNISNVMPMMSSPHLMASSHLMESGPDPTDASISILVKRHAIKLTDE